MSRRGWVTAETGPGQWRRLMVFDDGWVELPGFGRSMSDTRSRLRAALLLLVLVVGSLAAIVGISRLIAMVDDPPTALSVIPGVLVGAVIVGVAVISIRWSARDIGQVHGDAAQARDERRAGVRIKAAPGAPRFRRADSAEQFAGWIHGGTHVALADIATVEVDRDGRDHVVSVGFVDGPPRTYRSPDGKLVELLGRADRPSG